MKRFQALLLIAVMIITMLPGAAAGQEKGIEVYFKGSQISFDVAPSITNGRTMVPMRAIFETLGYIVDWDGSTEAITAQKGDSSIMLTVGSSTASAGGKNITLDAPPVIDNGRVLVPLRFVSESAGYDVLWDGDNRKVYIEPRNPDEYDSVQEDVSIAAGVGDSVLYLDYDKDYKTDIYLTKFGGNTSVKIIDGAEAYNVSTAKGTMLFAPHLYNILRYEDGKAYVSSADVTYDVDLKAKSKEITQYSGMWGQKIFGNYMYYEKDGLCRRDLSTGKDEDLCSIDKILYQYTVSGDMIYYTEGMLEKDTYLYQYDIKNKQKKMITVLKEQGGVQAYKGYMYFEDGGKLFRLDPKDNGIMQVSAEGATVSIFEILNDTIFYKYKNQLNRAPLDFSYAVKISDQNVYSWSVVGNHIFYDNDEEKTFMMRTDGSENVMLRKSGRSYVEPDGSPVDDMPGLEVSKQPEQDIG
ncbi:MAG: stalk domain-containing protein [Bacillota bacterium]|nr:stalk domain-containing protein [Bacillota bacterium]